MLTRDNLFVINAVISGFELETVKNAREKFFTCVEPGVKYAYQGKRDHKTTREKLVHATETLVAKMNVVVFIYDIVNDLLFSLLCSIKKWDVLMTSGKTEQSRRSWTKSGTVF